MAKAKINFGRMTKETAFAQVRDLVGDGYVWVRSGQIEDCLDNIPHKTVLKMLQKLSGDRALVKVVRDCLNNRPADLAPLGEGMGVPVGMVLAEFLCQLYLHRFDQRLRNKRVTVVRFQDNFVVLGADKVAVTSGWQVAERQLHKMGLTLTAHSEAVVQSSSRQKFLGKRLPNAQPRWQWEDVRLLLSRCNASLLPVKALIARWFEKGEKPPWEPSETASIEPVVQPMPVSRWPRLWNRVRHGALMSLTQK